MKNIIKELREELNQKADEKTKESGKRFFREEIKLYGIKSALLEAVGRNFYKVIPDKSKSIVFKACEELLKSGMFEESILACQWSYNVRQQYVSSDLMVFGQWIDRYVSNWATCDTLCNHSVGSLVEMYPGTISGLKQWTTSENRWMKRASAVSLIIPAKKGKFLNDIFEIADSLLTDRDDMVQKGYGWMLKVASQAHLNKVFEYVIKHKTDMPRTAYRYAIEKMPEDLRAIAMKK